jgi:hypothetical protein
MPTLAQVYEQHSEECVRAAAKTDDPKQRALLLKLASEWREDAKALLRVAESAPSDAPASVPPQTNRKEKPRPRVKLRRWRERRNKR